MCRLETCRAERVGGWVEEMVLAVWQAPRLSAAWADGAVVGQWGEYPPPCCFGQQGFLRSGAIESYFLLLGKR